MLLMDLFFAGMETTVTTLKWAFLLVVLHPEVHRRLLDELDAIPSAQITLKDKPRLVYTQAVIQVFPFFLHKVCRRSKEWQTSCR